MLLGYYRMGLCLNIILAVAENGCKDNAFQRYKNYYKREFVWFHQCVQVCILVVWGE